MEFSGSDVGLAVVLSAGWLLLALLIYAMAHREESRGESSAAVVRTPRPQAARTVLALSPRAPFRARYDRDRDLFFLATAPHQPTASYKRAGDTWVRYVPMTGEIIGVEIEDFVSAFLPGHPALQRRWQRRAMRAPFEFIRRRARQAFTWALLAHLQEQISAEPAQYPLPRRTASSLQRHAMSPNR